MTRRMAIGEIEPRRDSSDSDWALAVLHNHPTPVPHTHARMHTHARVCARTHTRTHVHRDQGKREGEEEIKGLSGLKC